MFCTVDKQSSVWSIFRNKVAIKVMNGKSMEEWQFFPLRYRDVGSWSWSIVNYENVRTGERCLKLVNMINPNINYNNYNPSFYILSMKPKSFIDSLIRKTERNFLLGCSTAVPDKFSIVFKFEC